MDNGSDETNPLKEKLAAETGPITVAGEVSQQLQNEEVVELGTLRILNEAAVRDYALQCSKQFKNGKFTRVGQDFLDEIRADVEAMVRAIENNGGIRLTYPQLEPGDLGFTTGALCDRVMEKWNRMIAKMIQRKVERQPSVGKTLSRTR